MKLLNLAIFKILLYLISGIIAGFYLPEYLSPSTALHLSFLLCALCGLSFLYRRKVVFEVACALLFTVIGFSQSQGYYHAPQPADIRSSKLITCTFTVNEVLTPSTYAYRYSASGKITGKSQPVLHMILSIPDSVSEGGNLKPGYAYTALVETITPAAPQAPESFNYREFLKKKGVNLLARIYPESLMEHGKTSDLRYWFFSLNSGLNRKIDASGLDPFSRGLLKALVLGDRSEIDPSFYEALKDSGGAHLIALSGLHIGILTTLLSLVFWPLRRHPFGKILHFILISSCLVFYVLLIGGSASVIRAATMWSFLAFSILLQQRSHGINTLMISALVLLLLHPPHIFDIGFQLSYAAVTGIMLITPLILRVGLPKNPILRYLHGLVSVSIAAQLSTAPLLLFYFKQFSTTFLLTNLALTPLTLIFLTGSYAFVPVLAVGIQLKFEAVLNLLGEIIRHIGASTHLPHLQFQGSPAINLMTLLLLYTLLGGVLYVIYKRRHYAIIPLLLLLLQGWYIHRKLVEEPPQMIIHNRYRESLVTVESRDTVFFSERKTDTLSKPDLTSKHYFRGRAENLLVVDAAYFEIPLPPKNLVVLLTGSTQINLDRMLEYLQPRQVIADANNYPYLIDHWRLTCAQKNIPFHYTGEKGYYIIN